LAKALLATATAPPAEEALTAAAKVGETVSDPQQDSEMEAKVGRTAAERKGDHEMEAKV
jgi:hypothetical protein